MKINLNTLIDFFDNNEIPEQEIRLNEAEVVKNPKLFVETHLTVLKRNRGNKAMLPYYLRLEKFYLIVKNEKNN